MEFAGASDKGLTRPNNEDAYYADQSGLFIVADGLGGNVAGDVASNTAVEETKEYLKRRYHELLNSPKTVLTNALKHVNEAVLVRAERNPSFHGMGSTIVLGFLTGNVLHLVHVGDSRAYRIRPHESIQQLTIDHSYVEELITRGEIDPEQATSHPMRNIVTRCLGLDRNVQADYKEVPLRAGDYALFCTDGLTTMVTDEAIAATISTAKSITETCKLLVEQANTNGGLDNITVILVKQ